MEKFLIAIILIFCLSPIFANGQAEGTTTDMFSDYMSWTKVNRETITGDATGVLGPAHEGAKGFREIYVNDLGKPVYFGEMAYPFPVGTIIVKESYNEDNGMKGILKNLTVMVKKTSGYDPANGDWEYIMASPTFDVMDQGKIGMCIGCHSAEKDKDFTFWNSKM